MKDMGAGARCWRTLRRVVRRLLRAAHASVGCAGRTAAGRGIGRMCRQPYPGPAGLAPVAPVHRRRHRAFTARRGALFQALSSGGPAAIAMHSLVFPAPSSRASGGGWHWMEPASARWSRPPRLPARRRTSRASRTSIPATFEARGYTFIRARATTSRRACCARDLPHRRRRGPRAGGPGRRAGSDVGHTLSSISSNPRKWAGFCYWRPRNSNAFPIPVATCWSPTRRRCIFVPAIGGAGELGSKKLRPGQLVNISGYLVDVR